MTVTECPGCRAIVDLDIENLIGLIAVDVVDEIGWKLSDREDTLIALVVAHTTQRIMGAMMTGYDVHGSSEP